MSHARWINPSGGFFFDSANWRNGFVPGSADVAILGRLDGTSYGVVVQSAVFLKGLQTAANVRVTVFGGSFIIASDGSAGGASNGTILVAGGSSLEMGGTFKNKGNVLMEAAGGSGVAALRVHGPSLTLTGGGKFELSDSILNSFSGDADSRLVNRNNTVSGAGILGAPGLILVNKPKGIFNASGSALLEFYTGSAIIKNGGIFESTESGGCLIASRVNNTGILAVINGKLTVSNSVTGSGSAEIGGGTLSFHHKFRQDVKFTGTTGILKLYRSRGYDVEITGFSRSAGTSLVLKDIAFTGAGEASFSGDASSGVLTVTDGSRTARLTLIGDYTGSHFITRSNGHNGVKIMASPATIAIESSSVAHSHATPAPHRFITAMAAFGSVGDAMVAGRETRGEGYRPLLSLPGHPHPAVA